MEGILAGHGLLSQGDDWTFGSSGERDDDKAVKSAVVDFANKSRSHRALVSGGVSCRVECCTK